MPDEDAVDLAVAAYIEDGAWRVGDLAPNHLADVGEVAEALRHLPGEAGALAMIAVDEDFFLLVRVHGPTTRVLLSDVTAAEDWDIAASALTHLGLPLPGDEEEQDPAGDFDLVEDLGVTEAELAELLDDEDLYPDELLSEVARLLGFGELFDEAAGLTSA
jgi:putative tRNA adenosine deaminase-associated protein